MGFFRYGELPLVLLALLQQRPMNGYEMLSELGRLFSPGYAPSPGSVYPAISALRRSGLIGAEAGDPSDVWHPINLTLDIDASNSLEVNGASRRLRLLEFQVHVILGLGSARTLI